MGVFTEKSLKWEIQHGWYVFVASLIPFVAVFFLYSCAKASRMRSLLQGFYVSVVLLAVLSLTFILAIEFIFGSTILAIVSNVGPVLLVIIFLYPGLLLATNAKVFFQRIHLKTFIYVEWDKDYNYIEIIDKQRMNEIRTTANLIVQLEEWDVLIKDEQVSKYIVELMYLTKKYSEQQGNNTELFIERHSYSLNTVLRQYHQLELIKIKSDKVIKLQQNLVDTLVVAIGAFKQEVLDAMKLRNMSLEVDLDIYVGQLKNEGLI